MSKRAKTTGKIIFVLLLVAAICYTFRDSAVPIFQQLKKTAPLILILIVPEAGNAEDGEPDTFVPRNDQYIISSTRASRSWCSSPT